MNADSGSQATVAALAEWPPTRPERNASHAADCRRRSVDLSTFSGSNPAL